MNSDKFATTYALSKQLPDILARGLNADTAYGTLVIHAHEVKAIARQIEKVLRKRLGTKTGGAHG